MKILIVEDEIAILNSIVSYFEKEKCLCETATSCREASEKIFLHQYDCIILDINLPDGLGFELLEDIKSKKQDTGVLILSARNGVDDRIKGLDLGSDDYLTKPFHLSELNARVKAIIRRKNFNVTNELGVNEIVVDLNSKTILINNKEVFFSKKEYDLLLYFLRNANRVISKTSISEHLWGDDMDIIDDFELLYAQVKNLRKKLKSEIGEDYISTVYGMGYLFKKK
jgi:DNA-binding response OmpR family regulator